MDFIQKEVCSICLEPVLIPVEPLCFQCRRQKDVWCFAIKRVCLLCLEQYLGLDCPKKNRPLRKCLFCPEPCLLMSKEKSFRVDYGLMNQDSDLKHCPFCTFKGSHIAVARHVFNECLFYKVECECGQVIDKKEIETHKKTCSFHTKCPDCLDFILKNDLLKHMFYGHDKTRCFTCHGFVKMSDLNHHLIKECPERNQTCEFCALSLKNSHYKTHLKKHFDESIKTIKQLQLSLQKEKKLALQIQKQMLSEQEEPPSPIPF